MELHFLNKPSKNSTLIYPVFEKGPVNNATIRALVQKLGRTKEFERKQGQAFFAFTKTAALPERIVLVGLAEGKKLAPGTIMEAFGSAMKKAVCHNAQRVSVILPPELLTYTRLIVEALVMSNYNPAAAYKTGEAAKKLQEKTVKTLEIIGLLKQDKKYQTDAKKGLAVAGVANEVRDMVNAPPNIATTDHFEEKSKRIAKETGAKLTIMRNKDLTKLGMGALLAVNRGSPDEALFVILDYTPRNADPKKAPLVFVGKGLIFDSGGYNLKPRGHIEDMQLDKAGAAAVLGLMKILPILNVNRRVIGIAPFTESLIGKNAFKPSEILKTYAGKTVEITNTDGEGRLILSDAIAYAIDKYKPEFLVDIATLTGACMVALGDRYAGLFSNNKDLEGKLRAAGDATDELLWPLPIHKDYSKKMKGVYADLRNADLGSERYAGASKGAAFLQEFVGKTPWAHIDIAAPAFTTDPKKYEQKGATGFGLRVLAQFLENL